MSRDKDHVAGLAIQIPEQMIANVIQAEIVKAIPNPEAWVAAVVRKALEEPDRNSYGRKTKFEDTVEGEIRDLAKTVFREWLNGQKEKIRDQLVTELNRRNAKRVKEIAGLLADAMGEIYVHSISLGVKTDG